MKPVGSAERARTHFTERKIFRSSILLNLPGGSRSRSIDEGSGNVEFHVDQNTKKLVNSALSGAGPEKAPEFVLKPKRQFVNEGESAKFKASFDGPDTTVLSWSLHGNMLTNDITHKIYSDKDVHILELPKVTPQDQGSYVCKIENSAGSPTASAELEVFVRPKSQTGKSSMFLPPTIDVPLEATEFVDKEKDATLVCKFHNAIDGAAKWYKDGREVGNWQAKATFDGRTARLILREASKKVCGVYECIVTNSGGEAKTSAPVSLLDRSVKPVPPKFTVTLSDQALETGEKLILETEVTGTPRPSLKWYKDNQELGSSQDIRMEFKDGKGRLIADNLDLQEGSKFTCIAKNIAGEDKTMASVTLSGSAEVREPPIFTKELQDMEVSDGDRVEMSVEVKGTPPIDIVWVHNNREIPPTDPVCRMITKGNTHMLVIPEVFPEDSGEYVCEAYNDYGDTDTFCRLRVHEEKDVNPDISQSAPEFVTVPQNLKIDEGLNANLCCKVTGTPPPSVQWSSGRQILKHGTKYKISSIGDEHFLELVSATVEDSGQYTCTLCNPVGTTSATCKITVGEATTTPSHRSYHKHRPLRNFQQRFTDTDSENSDASSLDSDSINANLAYKRNSEPFNTTTSSEDYFIARQISAPLSRNPINLYDHTQVPKSESVKNETVHRTEVVKTLNVEHVNGSPLRNFSEPASAQPDSELKPRGTVSEIVHHNRSKVEKLPEGKAGATQFDFRGVLKTTNLNTNSGASSINGHSTRLVNNVEKSKPEIDDFSKKLSQKRQVFEQQSKINVPKCVPKVKPKESKDKCLKVNEALRKFEDNSNEVKTDFRNVLKHRRELPDHIGRTTNELKDQTPYNKDSPVDFRNTLKHRKEPADHIGRTAGELRDQSPAGKHSFGDFRNVLKHKKESLDLIGKATYEIGERSTVSQDSPVDFRNVLRKRREDKLHSEKDLRKSQLEAKSEQLSDSSFEKKSLQKQRAELVVNVRAKSIDKASTPKQTVEFDFTSKSKTESPTKTSEKVTTPKQRVVFDFTGKTKSESPLRKDFETSPVKIDLSTQVAKPKVVKAENKLVEHKTTDKDNKSSPKEPVDLVKPIPRRISLSKSLAMDVKPEFKKQLENQLVEYGSEVSLQCHVTGVPQPDICWSVDDKEIKQSKFFRMSYSDEMAQLVIAEAFSEDEGEYTCSAINTAGTARTSCRIKVLDQPHTPENTEDTIEEPFSPTATPPKIYNVSPSEFCILQGGTIEFKASFTSVPPGQVTWCKNKQELKSGNRMKIETSDCFSTLTIENIHPEDSGRFDIKVENKLGTDAACASLTVEDVPEPPVGQPWVSEVTLNAVTLSWYGPAYDGGCPVTNYRVEVCDAEDQEWTLVTSKCVSTTYRIENLQAHTPYFFRVIAENKHGLSAPCMTPDVTVTSDRRPSALLRLPSTESDDVFTHESHEVFTPLSEYGIVSPLSPDEIAFEHREVPILPNRQFESLYNCMEEIGKGKFGSVYRCEEKATGKIWAAKFLKCRENEKKKLHLEIEIMNKLKHPKILMLWDAFEAPRKMILVMEYIGGGELFERVIDDDFELTERDCIQFMRQICDGVNYMHKQNILHLDLKPENILCIKNESNKIKIIDFGLARYYTPGESNRVLFGTPEFIAPEVVNYEEIGFTTDMWSVGVICYVLLTGLSPFMGDSDAETLSNVTHGEYDFEEEEFESVSEDGKNFITKLLVKNKKHRMTSSEALEHPWLAGDTTRLKNRRINTKNLKRFMARRKWQKTGHAIRALGRMKNSLQKFAKQDANGDSLSSASGLGSSSSSSLSSTGSQSTFIGANSESNSLKVNAADETVTTNQNGGNIESTNRNTKKFYLTNDSEIDKNCERKHGGTNLHRPKVDVNLNEENENLSAFVKIDSERTNEHRSVRSSTENGMQDSKAKHLPKFTKEMIDSKAFPGDNVRFDVEFIVDNNTRVTWYFEDEILVEDKHHCVQNSGNGTCSLIVKDVCEDDDGEYSCTIRNDFGEESCSAELIVYGAL